MSDPCVFCAIISGREAASRVYEDEHTLAFMNLRQANAGHVLVVPKAHVSTIDGLSFDQAAALGKTVVRVSRVIRSCLDPAGLSVWQSNGEAAGQEIFHVHVHVLPRRRDDGLLDIYPNLPPVEPRHVLDALAGRLRGYLDQQ